MSLADQDYRQGVKDSLLNIVADRLLMILTHVDSLGAETFKVDIVDIDRRTWPNIYAGISEVELSIYITR